MHIDWWTLALQAINVLILVWLLARFLFRPVMDAIAARQAAADRLIADAAALKSAAAAQEATLEARNKTFAADADTRRAALQAELDVERARQRDQAREEAARATKQAAAAADAESARLAVDLQQKATELAGRMAGKLLARIPPDATTDAMFAALIVRIATLPEEQRQVLAAAAPVTAVTPAPIGENARHRYGETLAAALPGTAVPDFAVDPALIAGFEIRTPHMVVRNSWRADLDDLLATLKEDGHARIG